MSEAYKHRRIGGRKGKMRLAHHVAWEEKHGPIPEGYEIHHLDEDKKNNDLENLMLVTRGDHQKMHSPHYALLEGVWKKVCKECRKIGPPNHYAYCNACRTRKARIERRQKNER